MSNSSFMQVNQTIEFTPIPVSPQMNIVGASVIVHSIIGDFSKFKYTDYKTGIYVIGKRSFVGFFYEVNKVVTPMIVYPTDETTAYLVTKYELDFTANAQ